MRRLAKAAVAGALLTALVLPALALGQGGAPTLREEPTAGFPDRAFILQLPQSKALSASQLDVTENGGPVLSVGVEAPGGSASGAVLLIDASNSMRGAPIDGAMVAAREFLGARSDDLPVAIITFGASTNVLSEFTTDEAKLTEAVAENPPLTEGTAMYDAVVRAAELAQDEGLGRATVVLLSDGNDIGSSATSEEAVAAAREANMRVVSVGLQSAQFEPASLRTLSRSTDGTFALAANEAALAPIFEEIGARLSNEYLVTYRSLLPANVKANVRMAVAGVAAPATASYTTPAIDVTPGGTFEREWIDEVIVSPWLFVFVIVAVLTLIAFAILAAVDVRKRSLRRRMAQYVSVPSEEESRMRRAEVTAMLADRAQRNVSRLRSWQGFEADVELANFKMSALAIAAWTIVGGIVVSIAVAAYYQSLWGLLAGLAAPFVTRYIVSRKVKKTKAAFDEQLPDNLDVLAGAMRTGHSIMGALSVMVESADDPSKKEFRRVLQDEQLGVPLDDALMVMARRMQSYDAEQVALVMKLQREAGGNTAEVLDRVAETIRGRMELRRLVNVLTAQARISRWILTSLPIFVFLMLSLSGGDYLDPMTSSLMGKIALVVGAILILIGSFWIKRISKLDV